MSTERSEVICYAMPEGLSEEEGANWIIALIESLGGDLATIKIVDMVEVVPGASN
jgi:hypothetical protein